jgi:hypothetical protein
MSLRSAVTTFARSLRCSARYTYHYKRRRSCRNPTGTPDPITGCRKHDCCRYIHRHFRLKFSARSQVRLHPLAPTRRCWEFRVSHPGHKAIRYS